MTKEKINIFREALRSLSFSGVSIQTFAKNIGVHPHTIYNYICGQTPSKKYYDFIMYILERDYPETITNGIEMSRRIYNV